MMESNNGQTSQYPLISVITLSYNCDVLYDSIQSVLDQTYPMIEYIIVDDGSKYFDVQGISFYIEKNKKKNIVNYRIVVNPKNFGTSKTSNIALKLTHGEYIFNLAADDAFYDPNVIEEWVREFQSRGVLVMTGLSAVYDSSLGMFQQMLPSPKERNILRKEDPERLFRYLCRTNIIYGCSTARSRQVIEQLGFYDESYRIIEDYPYALRLSRNGIKIGFWERPVIRYRRGGISSVNSFNQIYQKDSDLIFRREILPYVKFPLAAQLYYFKWRWRRIRSSQFYEKMQKTQEIGNVWGRLLLYATYPVNTLRHVKHYFLGKYRSQKRV